MTEAICCNDSYGTDPALYCDREPRHEGPHVETWVARWNQDHTDVEWYVWESGAYVPGPTGPVHWVGEAPTSRHGNGAASFERTTRDCAEVTCSLCLTLLDRESSDS